MKILKSHFWYNKRQRNGIFFLVLLIIVFQLIYFFVDLSSGRTSEIDTNEIELFKKQLDSLQRIEKESNQIRIFPFNPSFLTDYKGSQLGMSTKEIDRLLNYRQEGKYINSSKQFQVVTKVSDSLLASISPYFKFPSWLNKKTQPKKDKIVSSKSEKIINKRDLNDVSAIELREINGIGETLAKRIVKYRKSINGFSFDDQLNEVYGLKVAVINRILKRYTVLSKPVIKKLNVNTATFKEILHLPYIDYELTKRIFQYKDEVAEIQAIEELKNIEGFPLENFNRIIVYLEAK